MSWPSCLPVPIPAVSLVLEDTISGKWGTHVEVCDEGDQRFMDFVYDAARATMRHLGLAPLEGPAERMVLQLGEDASPFALFLWPYDRPRTDSSPNSSGAASA